MGVFYYDYFKQKRITAVVVSAFILTFVFVLATEKREMVPTVTLPVSGKTIILDAGHGKPDEGAQSSNGTTVAQTNLKIAL